MKTYIILILLSIFIFQGCQKNDTNNNTSTITQQDDIDTLLKKEDFKAVIERLEGKAQSDEEYLALGSAYMGLSGLKISDVIQKICDSQNAQEGTSLQSFTNSAKYDKKKCDVPLSYLNKATNYFMNVIKNQCTEDPDSLSQFERDVCVYKGLSQTMEAITTINYIQEDNKLKASSCAMEYALKGKVSECSIYIKGKLSFINNTKTYEDIFVYLDGDEYEFLLAKDQYGAKQVIVTDGYCKVDDYTTKTDDKELATNASYHVCPININEDTPQKEIVHPTTNQFIVNAFNQGTSSILTGSDDKVLTDTIEIFKKEIYQARESFELSLEQNTTNKKKDIKHDAVSEEDILLYLKKQTL